MLRWYAIQGSSLEPEYRAGDYALAARLPGWWGRLRAGDMVICRHPAYGILVKRVQQIDPARQEVTVTGSQPESVDSRIFGPLPRAWVLGKVIWHIKKNV